MELLSLPVPDQFPMFPYDKPYSIQLGLMRHLYESIEKAKVAIIESPTGTGKTLSLLCGALTWLTDEKERAKRGKLQELKQSLRGEGSNEPEWVLEQSLAMHKRELEALEEEFQARLEKARQKEESIRRMEKAHVRKKPKLTHDPDVEDEDIAFLPEDEAGQDDNISPEVLNLMKKLEATKRKTLDAIEEEEPTCTKIYYASRTHSQLSQLHTEFVKLKSPATNASIMARVVPLASRKVLCINQQLRDKGGDLDEGCRELMSEKSHRRCPYLPPKEEETRMLDFRDHILAVPKDIEDLVLLGKELNTCPYYGSRRAIKQAELVTLPYNLLLQKTAREALEIDVTGQVVIIDEAHNLIDTVLSTHSLLLTSTTLRTSLLQLKIYFTRFRSRLTPKHALHLKRLLGYLESLEKFCEEWKSKGLKVEMMSTSGLVSQLGSKVEGLNLLEVGAYLRSSKIARKISGYSDNLAEKAAAKDLSKRSPKRKGVTPPLHAVESFLPALTDANVDGRIFISLVSSPEAGKEAVHIKYQLLNPARHFQEIIEAARSVVLAGGTMSPISDFGNQLFPQLPPDRVAVFQCGHVIPSSNLKAIVVNRGPGGGELQFKFQQRGDKNSMAELSQIITNLVNIVPDGLVVFFPSYAFLNAVTANWKQSGTLEKLGAKKTILLEPQETGDVETVLKEYASAIHGGSKRGALLLAVVGAKLSEGLNFSDRLARAVVLIGLPFANLGSVELQERMRYVKELEEKLGTKRLPGAKDAGTELYENLCMKAVNQSIGRAIRHQNDWASLVLVDSRYATPRIRSKLPQWIGQDVSITQSFGQVVKELGSFYKDKRSLLASYPLPS